MTKRAYFQVRKVAWDKLWHALFVGKDGRTYWDRVKEARAIEISKRLIYNELSGDF
jgi:hypothetical protein